VTRKQPWRRLIGCGLLGLAATNVRADDYLAVAQIIYIRSHATWTYLGVTSAPAATTCDSWGEQFSFDHTTVDGKVYLTKLLAAQMANRAVDLWFLPSTAPGTAPCVPAVMAKLTGVRTR
jgi:hypothetical protein